jgi:molybdenum cofactor cytidylyltransferase
MISAIVLAAGLSIRMGQPKMLLTWGTTTVIRKVVETVFCGEIEDILIVTGGLHAEIEIALRGLPVQFKMNQDFANGEMLTSVQVGLNALVKDAQAALIVLGDQPQIQADVVRLIADRYQATQHPIIVPSYQMHRGHPWLVDRTYWKRILELEKPDTLREFLNTYNTTIDYIPVETRTVLQDLDTQEDYTHYKP